MAPKVEGRVNKPIWTGRPVIDRLPEDVRDSREHAISQVLYRHARSGTLRSTPFAELAREILDALAVVGADPHPADVRLSPKAFEDAVVLLVTRNTDIQQLREALTAIAEYGGGDGGDWVECCEMARVALEGSK